MLRLFLSLRLTDFEREICGGSRTEPARPGLRIDFEEIFMEDEEVKQKKRWVDVDVVIERCVGGGLSDSMDCHVITPETENE